MGRGVAFGLIVSLCLAATAAAQVPQSAVEAMRRPTPPPETPAPPPEPTEPVIVNTPTGLSLNVQVVQPGESVRVTITCGGGRTFVLMASTAGSGWTVGGVDLELGPDAFVAARGVCPATGYITLELVPPFT